MENIPLSRTQGEILLAGLVLARSVSYVLTKVGLRELQAFNLLGIRFIAAFLLLLPFVGWRKLKGISMKTVFKGMLLGAIFTSALGAEAVGLRTASASNAALLINMAIVFVPLFEAILRRSLPSLPVTLSTLTAMAGVALLTLKGHVFSLSQGEFLCLTGSIFYACVLIITDRLSRKNDPLTLGILQVGFMGLHCTTLSFLFESPIMPTRPATWGILLALAVVCTCFGYTLQPLAQSGTTSQRAALFCALGPVGGAFAGWAFLSEKLSLTGLLGMALILMGMFLTKFCDKAFMMRNSDANIPEPLITDSGQKGA